MPREPQSYGSQKDWQTGKTDQQVHDPKAAPPTKHAAFYDESRDDEPSAENHADSISPVQMAENLSGAVGSQPTGAPPAAASTPVQKVSAEAGGAKRDSYFKKRDYD